MAAGERREPSQAGRQGGPSSPFRTCSYWAMGSHLRRGVARSAFTTITWTAALGTDHGSHRQHSDREAAGAWTRVVAMDEVRSSQLDTPYSLQDLLESRVGLLGNPEWL